jgi:hypothetical protein
MFKVEFATDNAAFEDNADAEVRRILVKVADEVGAGYAFNDGGKYGTVILDSNGNSVGRWYFEKEED